MFGTYGTGMAAFLVGRDYLRSTFEMNGYELDVTLDEIFGSEAKSGYGLIISTGPNQFLGVGSGYRVAFSPRSPGAAHAGIGWIEEGSFSEDAWVPERRLNGDENDQGQFWRFAPPGIETERVRVHRTSLPLSRACSVPVPAAP